MKFRFLVQCPFKVTSMSKELFVVRARVRCLPCVDHIMSFEVAGLKEELVTVRTIVRFSPVWLILCYLRCLDDKNTMLQSWQE